MADPNQMETKSPSDDETHRPPLFGSWRKAYLVIVLVFIFEVVFFYLIDHYFA